MKKILLVAVAIIILSVAGGAYVYRQQVRHQQQISALQAAKHSRVLANIEAARKAKAALKQVIPPPLFDKKAMSNYDPTSLWVVVNKQRSLQPKDYAPNDLTVPNIPLRSADKSSEMQLRKAAAIALEQMSAAAIKDSAHLMVASGYRSYGLQVSVYGSEVKAYGQAKADSESARPGYSEHQTGLAVDLEPTSRVCEIADCFAETIEGKWLTAHAAEYGFMQRYTADKVGITGYRAEAWHYRYVGTALTNELRKQGVSTLEEFFGLAAAPDYTN